MREKAETRSSSKGGRGVRQGVRNSPLGARAPRGYLALRLGLLLERLRQAKPLPKPPPALFREHPEVRTPLRLDLPYYAARRGGKFILIPWDGYMEEVERALEEL